MEFFSDDKIEKLSKSIVGLKKIDLLELFIKDLFEYRHPHLYKKECSTEYRLFKEKYISENRGVWVYYPWLKTAYRILREDHFLEVFTSRNKPYVTQEEQKNYYDYNIGIAGLSVGQSSALTIIRSGGSRNIKIADFDMVSPSNLNRLHLGLNSVGEKKTEEVSKKLLEINPFLNIKSYNNGITEKNANDFFSKDFQLNAVVDSCDNFEIKLLLRRLAKKYKIPLIMVTDIGDGTLVDIERYDKNPNTEPFGGRHKRIKNTDGFQKAALTIISPEHIPATLQDRFFEIGRSVPTHPQLANAVYLSGSIVSYLTRCLANNREIVDERILLDFDDLFNPEHKKDNFINLKKAKTGAFKRLLGME